MNVCVKHYVKDNIFRWFIGNRSEGSYLSDVIKCLNNKRIDEIDKLFGGFETSETNHNKYRVHLSSIDNSHKCYFHVLDVPVICSHIRKVPNAPWLTKLNKFDIKISNVENSVCKAQKWD